jgi:[CysO sulfur-carrier protein]-S-L-cysteine hydrolase
MPFQLLLPRAIYDEMLGQALAELPNECCGLLAGRMEAQADAAAAGPPLRLASVLRRYPLVNKKASPTRYFSEESSLFDAHRDARQNNLEFLAIYHSHPTSDPVPSRTDLAENYWDGVMHFIISLKQLPPLMRGWWLSPTDYQPADWQMIDR